VLGDERAGTALFAVSVRSTVRGWAAYAEFASALQVLRLSYSMPGGSGLLAAATTLCQKYPFRKAA
jgi:hypothetical protein